MRENSHKIYVQNGYYIFKLELLLKEISKTKYDITKNLFIEYKVLNRYINGNLSKFDMNIIARICDYLNCKLSDIIEYYPNEN